jgi:hypothetical protein
MAMGFVLSGAVVSMALYYNLQVGTSLSRRKRWLFSNGLALAFISVVTLMIIVNKDDESLGMKFSTVLKPAVAKIAPAQNVDEFFRDARAL